VKRVELPTPETASGHLFLGALELAVWPLLVVTIFSDKTLEPC
jgi:hypothetical protein